MFQGHENHTLENFGGKGAAARTYRDGFDSIACKLMSEVES